MEILLSIVPQMPPLPIEEEYSCARPPSTLRGEIADHLGAVASATSWGREGLERRWRMTRSRLTPSSATQRPW